jgi:hypothetical protein
MTNKLQTLVITIIIAISIITVGCSSNSSNRKPATIKYRCESMLTKSGKACQNPVKSDEKFCNRHQGLEDSRAKAVVKELEEGKHITEETRANQLFDK